MSAPESAPYKAYLRTSYADGGFVDKSVIAPLHIGEDQSPDLLLSRRAEIFNHYASPLDLPFILTADVTHQEMFDVIPTQVTTFRYPEVKCDVLGEIQGKLDALTVHRLGFWLATSMKEVQRRFSQTYPDMTFCGNGDIKPPHVIGSIIIDWDTSILLPILPPFSGAFVTVDFASMAHLELSKMSEEALRMMSQDVVSIVKVMMWSAVGDAAYPNLLMRNEQTNKVSQDTSQVSVTFDNSEIWRGHERLLISMMDTLLMGNSIEADHAFMMSALSVTEVDVFHEMLEVMRDVLERDIDAYDRNNPMIRMGMDEFIFRLQHLDTDSFVGVLETHSFAGALSTV